MSADSNDISREILAHLAENPEAQDTVEGIAEWWLLERFVRRRVAEVREVLKDLVEQRLVIERRGGDSRRRYQVNPKRLAEIRSMLRKWTG